jgi:peptidyl-prolyl cis-trans isomerase C
MTGSQSVLARYIRAQVIAAMAASLLALNAWAQGTGSAAGSALPAGAVATVNGSPISKAQIDRAVAQAAAQGRADSPELRRAILDEFIAREVLAQEAVKQKLDRSNDARIALSNARQSVLVDLLITDHLAKNPVNDVAIKAEYDRQLRVIEERGGNQQYRLRQITVANEAEARAVIARIRKGESMETIARQSSIAPSKEQGGLLDWLSPLQILPAVSSVIVNLKPGVLAAAPIQTQGGWNVIRVEEIRPFKPPTLEESRHEIRELLTREQRAALIRKLRAEAKVLE